MSSKSPRWVLLVDDSRDDVEPYSETLHQHGFNVVSAQNGEQALEKVRLWAPSVIVLDIMLPDINGLEVCRRVKADSRTRHIPVIALSALSDLDVQARATKAGCASYLVKPCLPPRLIHEIGSWMPTP